MGAVSSKLNELRSRGDKALVLFVTAGDPPLDQLPAILSALEEGGADVIEIGIPFSDPIADGPTIQASSQRALDRGVRLASVLQTLSVSPVRIPKLAMGYANTWMRMGHREAARRLAEAGLSGAIISDLTPEESDDWVEAAKERGLDTVFLVAPTSTDDRIRSAASRTTGFVYAVSRTGVTGAGATLPPDAASLVARVRSVSDLPVCVGFGVSTPDHVSAVCEVADGAVVGSWLVNWLAESWNSGAGRAALVQEIRKLKAATR